MNPSAPACRATGTIDRSSNTVRIDAEGIAQATVFLNDELVDLSRPVRVIASGAEQGSVVVPRRMTSFLEMIHDGTSDAAAVYVARVDLDLTGAAAAPAAGAGADPEYERLLAAAGNEVAKLWELHLWCASTQRTREDARVLRTIVRLDPEHGEARAARGDVRERDQWFTSAEALERFRRSQDPEAAAGLGRVEYRGLWMHRDERALAVKGWVKDQETGQWLAPGDRKKLAEGWARQDLAWIPPQDAARADEGLWWVGGEWLDLERADRRHAVLDDLWRIPGAEVTVHSTARREVALRARREMERALADLRRVFGTEPVLPIRVAVLRDEEQYDRFAFGDPDGRRVPAHAGRLQVVHSAFFAESWFARLQRATPGATAADGPEFMGMGVCYWDSSVPNGDLYGVHAARLAAGLSFVDALDPSPKAVRKALAAGGPGPEHFAAYETEKELPAWLRWGGAVYAERYLEDASVGPEGDRWWARNWSLDNLGKRGGLRALDQVLAFRLDPDDRDGSLQLLIEAGLVVAFVVDGGCLPLAEAHAAFREAMASGRIDAGAVTALTEAVRAHERELRAFAGL